MVIQAGLQNRLLGMHKTALSSILFINIVDRRVGGPPQTLEPHVTRRSKGQDLGERLTFSTEDGTENGECPFFWPGTGGRWWKIMSKGWTPAFYFQAKPGNENH